MKKLGVIIFMISLLSLGVFGGAITLENTKIDSVKKLDTNSIVEPITKISGNAIVETVKHSEVSIKETFAIDRIKNNEVETGLQNNKLETNDLVEDIQKNVDDKKRNSKKPSIKANLDLPLNFRVVDIKTLDDLCGYCGYVGNECKKFKDYVLKSGF